MPTNKLKIVTIIFLHLFLICAAFFTVYIPFQINFKLVSSLWVFILFIPIVYGCIKILGFKKGFILIMFTCLLALSIEAFALKTGIPYGKFLYGPKAGMVLFNIVPLSVPFAWGVILFGSGALVARKTNIIWKRIVFTAFLMLIIDLVLDPLAVHMGLWQWEKPGIYYGVPVINFIGWIFSGIIGSWLIHYFFKDKNIQNENSSCIVNGLYLSLVFWICGAIFSGLVFPSLIGCSILFYFRKFFLRSFSAYV